VLLSVACWLNLCAAWQLDSFIRRFPSLEVICGRPSPQVGIVEAWTASLPMLLTMALPLTIAGAKLVAERSLRARRQRSMLAYEAAYLGTWAAFGLVVIAAVQVIARTGVEPMAASAGLFAAAFLLSLSRPYRLLQASCHEVLPLAPVGPQADLSCLRFGAYHARACVITCGLATTAAMTQASPMPWMIAVSALACAERYRLKAASRWPAVAYALLAGLAIALWL
jgi:predicted metal-binding membrane protein